MGSEMCIRDSGCTDEDTCRSTIETAKEVAAEMLAHDRRGFREVGQVVSFRRDKFHHKSIASAFDVKSGGLFPDRPL